MGAKLRFWQKEKKDNTDFLRLVLVLVLVLVFILLLFLLYLYIKY